MFCFLQHQLGAENRATRSNRIPESSMISYVPSVVLGLSMEKNWRHYTKFASETELRIIAAQNSMALSAGTKLGTYEIVGLLGKGGMGEVL
jgi:hypothetical protein